jgi:hypothetical protein
VPNLPTSPPPGPVAHRWYAAGYQQALADLLARLDEGGEDAAREWISNNTIR